ncbi:MAG: hypothetical protein IJ484_04040 [Oscillospiraceae bacterium]|nr:hypothetical protein [Oscillospiraceae bacterium]
MKQFARSLCALLAGLVLAAAVLAARPEQLRAGVAGGVLWVQSESPLRGVRLLEPDGTVLLQQKAAPGCQSWRLDAAHAPALAGWLVLEAMDTAGHTVRLVRPGA